MLKTTLSERIEKMMRDMGMNQPEFGAYVGATKGAVNQWLSGLSKSIDAEYAFALQHKAGYSAEWVMFGVGPEKMPEGYLSDSKVASVVSCMQNMDEYGKDTLVKISTTLAQPDDKQRNG